MESDQLEEYRKMARARQMQRESRNDEALARQMQEEENRKLKEQAERDEEIAKKMNAQYSGAYYPAEAYPPQGNLGPPPYSNQSWQDPVPQNYPPPRQPPQQPYYQAPPPAQGAQQPLLPQRTTGVLPTVTDKCCGVNTQVCVLVTAGVLTAGVIATMVALLV